MFNKVTLEIAPNGNNLLGYLRGPEKNALDAYNSLFNWGATGRLTSRGDVDPEMQFTTHARDVIVFRSSPTKLFRYFYNRHLCRLQDDWGAGLPLENPRADLQLRKHAFILARETFAELPRVAFDKRIETPDCDADTGGGYTLGALRNENPDDDFKTAAFAGAKSSLDK